MMSPFSTLRQASDRKETRDATAADDDNDDNIGNGGNDDDNHANPNGNDDAPVSLAPLLHDNDNDDDKLLDDDCHERRPNRSCTLRIKLNDGGSSTTRDLALDRVRTDAETVGGLKERILKRYCCDDDGDGRPKQRYLRLIIRGRMMAPDSAALSSFRIVDGDVVHAVLAKEGVRGGQQARMLRRLNSPSGCRLRGEGNGRERVGGGRTEIVTSSGPPDRDAEDDNDGGGGISSSARRLWRRIGIDANGVVISPSSNEEEDDDDDDDSEWDEDGVEERGLDGNSTGIDDGDVDLEMGGVDSGNRYGEHNMQQQPSRHDGNRRTRRGGRRRGRRPRERRGFDRLRSTGMSRDEVTALRLYFSRSIDRYIERRRVIIRAANRLRSSLQDFSSRVVPNGSADENTAAAAASTDDESGNSLVGGGDTDSATPSSHRSALQRIGHLPLEGEEILNDRRRMEDEWMAIQGPYSEFRMNLNTNNPLLLAAIGGGTAPDDPLSSMPSGAAGLFLRRGASNGNGIGGSNLEDDDDDDLMFGGSLSPNGRFHPYMGSLPSAGTDKDFIWGFILGFFVGYIMLFWVWMPTVPHKQKIGIISGISFHSGLNLLRKSGRAGDVH
mmetsp:Transcript_20813/g.43000  ORF Transcript_20813/g.43000 Transcript_20813/m.43000 type:complete len:611 (-) Transcript_20813:214-2046(-)